MFYWYGVEFGLGLLTVVLGAVMVWRLLPDAPSKGKISGRG
jgi:hypothetical protein